MEKPENWEPFWDEDYQEDISWSFILTSGIANILLALIFFAMAFWMYRAFGSEPFWFLAIPVLTSLFFIYLSIPHLARLSWPWMFRIRGDKCLIYGRNLIGALRGKARVTAVPLSHISQIAFHELRGRSMALYIQDFSKPGSKPKRFKLYGGISKKFLERKNLEAFITYRITQAKQRNLSAASKLYKTDHQKSPATGIKPGWVEVLSPAYGKSDWWIAPEIKIFTGPNSLDMRVLSSSLVTFVFGAGQIAISYESHPLAMADLLAAATIILAALFLVLSIFNRRYVVIRNDQISFDRGLGSLLPMVKPRSYRLSEIENIAWTDMLLQVKLQDAEKPKPVAAWRLAGEPRFDIDLILKYRIAKAKGENPKCPEFL